MASTALTEKLKTQLTKDMDLLFGRARVLYPCPLEQGERKLFWHNTFPADIVAAHETLEAGGYFITANTSMYVRVKTGIVGVPFEIRFTSSQNELLQTPGGKRPHAVGENAMRAAFPYDTARWAAFAEWCERCANLDIEFSAALRTFVDILRFCGTVGQLTRALPDLRRHLPRASQEALADQARASNMPFQWAMFDRDRLAALQLVMCKAFLFPAASNSWTGYAGTWAEYA